MAKSKSKSLTSKNKKATPSRDNSEVKAVSKVAQNVKRPFYIVGVGASAGGLEALEHFFSNCPHDADIAFVIIQHLSPDYKSLMTELLSRHTHMVVAEAKNNVKVVPNSIYLIPRNKNLTLEGGLLKLTTRPPKEHMNFSIDIFFHSLAKEQKEMAIGVILSGTGSDGTRGGKSIKEVGGTIFVQNPDSSRFDGMPRSAINHGLGDYVLSPEKIPMELIQFVNNPHFAKTMMTGTELGKDIESMDKILKIIKNHTGYDFFSYKKPTLLRRTAKRMNISKCDTIADYIDYLYQTNDEKFILVEEFLIGVTKFFRDPEAYNILENQVVPDIVDSKIEKEQNIKIWIVACSTGEEAYSLAILFEEYIEKKKLDLQYKIFATDIDGRAIDKAARGTYSSNITLDVSAKRLSKYFNRNDEVYQIKPSIRKKIIFSKHDILQHPPFNKMDLVCCRNMLIYIDNPAQLKILANLHYSLNMNGYLMLGSSENIGLLNKNFAEVSNKWKIYRNIHPTKVVNLHSDQTWKIKHNLVKPAQGGQTRYTFDDKIEKLLNATLTEEFDAVSICIDKNFGIINATGKIKKFIVMPEVGYSNNLLKLLPEQLSISIKAAVRKLTKSKETVVTKNSKITKDGKLIQLKIITKPIKILISEPESFLIVIIEKVQRDLTSEEQEKELTTTKSEVTLGLMEEVGELKEALDETKESLQSTIEELETSNEEMQSTNEELLSSNEELQSTNEELQSLNEELHTVNAELQDKNVQLVELNSDIENLMININIGTIFLNKDLTIRKFTPAIREHFQLIDSDIGRPIEHFSMKIGGHDIVDQSKNVLKTLKPFRTEFQNANGIWFIMQIFPYRAQDDIIKGVVANFINIQALKEAFLEKEKLNSYISHLAHSSPVVLYVYDLQQQRNVFSSKSIFEIAGYTESEIKKLGSSLFGQIIHPDDMQKVLEHQTKFQYLKDDEFEHVEYRMIHKHTKEPIWILSTEKVNERDSDGKVKTILGVAQDISESKVMEIQLAESEERSRLALQGTKAGLWEWKNINKDDAWWSDQFYNLIGYNPKSKKASYTLMLKMIHPDHLQNFKKQVKEHLKHKTKFEVELMMKTKSNGFKWFKINIQAQWDNRNKPIKMVGTLLDIDEQYRNKEIIFGKQKKLEAIYSNAPVGIILVSIKGEITEVSDGFTNILGYSKAEIIGKSIFSIVPLEDVEKGKGYYKKLTTKETKFVHFNNRYNTKDKNVLWAQTSVKYISNPSGKDYLLGIINDITDEKNTEIKMQRLNEELERFAYLASHDLKEPLRTITSLTERLVEKHGKSLNKSAIRYINYIEKASSSMETLTSELLTYSQLGHKVKKYENINLNIILNKIKRSLQTSIKENNAVFDIAKLPNIKGDKIQIELLFQNLISNSLKYRKKAAPKIKIDFKDKGDNWEFSVKDNGIGIDKEYHDKIFEVFKRLHNSEKYAGTGIGLSNCKRIVNNHNGTIYVKSTPRRGATFFVTIPKKGSKTQ